MATTYSPVNAYRETKVKTASQGQIIVMLYDEAIRQLGLSQEYLDRGPAGYDKANASILKARDIITELMVSLDMEQGGEFAQRMFALYHWFNQELLDANFRKSVKPIQVVQDLMVDLRDAWAQIAGSTNVEGTASSGLNIAG